MKIGIYNEPSEGSIGGCEFSVAVLAEALSRSCEVDIVHHRSSLVREQLADFAAVGLLPVRLRYVEPENFTLGTSQNPWARYRQSRMWHACLSEPYDIFINFTHHYPPYCHARKGVLVTLFPLHSRPFIEFQAEAEKCGTPLRWERLKQHYYDWEWKQRMDTYAVKLSISQFTRDWTKRRWGIDSQVVYPPVETKFRVIRKENIILSVGRFATMGHSKKQVEMIGAFTRMYDEGLQNWEYICIGGVGDMPGDQAYFESVRKEGERCAARVLANVERARLKDLQEQAKIFWHAAGYGVDEERPELMEHFGIATVEAMAAGCVPIVINKGGQREIVEHGVNGFLWNTLDELRQYTQLLAEDHRLCARMGEAARSRALSFSRESFVEPFIKLLSTRVVPDDLVGSAQNPTRLD